MATEPDPARLSLQSHGVTVTFEDPPPEFEESSDAKGVRTFLRRGQFYEQAFLDYIRSLDRRGAYVDVGGFIGTHTLYFAMLCPSEHVYVFEPRPGPRAELERNVAANGLAAKVTVSALGLADQRKTTVSEIEEVDVTFECAPMDELVDRAVAVIKIDVEGMEVDVLRGATRILEQYHPVIFAEAHSIEHRQEIADYLARFGYVRTGRVFNSSPTYEFARATESSGELLRAYAEIGRLHDELDTKVVTLQQSLSAAQLKYREVVSHEKVLAQRLTTLDGEVHRLRSELLASTRAIHKHQTQEERLRQELRAAHAKELNTLSFQLGHALIQATKSRRGLLDLPRNLLGLRTEARLRRARSGGNRSIREVPISDGDGLISLYERAKRTDAVRPVPRFAVPDMLADQTIEPAARLAGLRVAGIMDEFTAASFGPECKLHHVRPNTWMRELPDFAPQLLFVESAWRGVDELWAGKVGASAPELRDLIDWCRAENIPTVFWNKEDPVHFAGFANTANLFDFVFTTDVDCIHRYKELLGHDRVYVMPFAAQPAAHNPIEHYERKAALCFAGAYYARYPERQRDFLGILSELQIKWPIDIYDRNFGDDNPDFQFPAQYRHLIRGKLPFDQIDRAYKGYQYAINLNSIKYSQSMFARRVFELLASNTVTISNFSRGIRLLLGDLVVTSDDPPQHSARLDDISQSSSRYRRFRLAGLRKVLSEHTYQDRLADVVQRAFHLEPLRLLPEVTVIGVVRNAGEEAVIRAAFDRQTYAHKRLILTSELPSTEKLAAHVAGFAAPFVAADYYGPSYLVDLALATRYWKGGVGKVAHHVWTGSVELVGDGKEYRPTASLRARASLVPPSILGDVTVAAFDADLIFHHDDFLAIDEFSYCRDGAGHPVTSAVDDLELDHGLPLTELLTVAQSIPEPEWHDEQRALGPNGLAGLFKATRVDEVEVSHFKGMLISSSLPEGEHRYVYARRDFRPAQLGFGKTGKLFVDVTPGLNLRIVLMYLDEAGERLDSTIVAVQTNHEIDVPPRAAFVRIGFRISGPGLATVRAVVFGNVSSSEPTRVFGRHDILVLTNIYPSADDLYRNAFVHRRVIDYVNRGLRADVFCLRKGIALGYHEFEGVDVVRGSKHILDGMLAMHDHRTVLVHFLDEAMWTCLQPHLERIKVLVWIHGSEVQPWHRRSFEYASEVELGPAKIASEARMKFWRSVLTTPHPNLKLVFVSQYFADEVQEDVGIKLPRSSYEIIHNLIDTELFTYERKPVEQRKKILTIRPFASRKYANDLSVEAIVLLSKQPFFKDLEFRVVGDGKLFDDTLAPLRGFSNVIIERKFLTQTEIAALHKQYGVFLSPTRMDAQGVSRDEAMASGLVPVTTNVAAIPEFVDDSCGFMAPLDDARGLAAAIETLYHDAALFERLSAAAAARVRGQSGPEQTTGREIELIRQAMQ